MSIWNFILDFAMEHRGGLIGLVVSLIGYLKLTAWGRNKAEALDLLVRIIESLNLTEVKNVVSAQQTQLRTGAVDALQVAVSKVDPKKRPAPLWQRFQRGLIR